MGWRSWAVVAGLLMVPVALAGCGGSAGDGSGGSGSPAGGAEGVAVWHRSFSSTEVTRDGRARPLLSGTQVRVAFEAGRVRASAGCNDLAADVRLDGDRLVVSGLGGTDKYCSRAGLQEQDSWLSGFLTSGPQWELTGDVLVLTAGPDRIRLTDQRVTAPARALRGTRWQVDTLIEDQVARSVSTPAYLLVDDQGAVHGSTGCRSFSGRATGAEPGAGSATITFSGVSLGDGSCSGEPAELDVVMRAALSGSVTVRIVSDRMTMSLTDGRAVVLAPVP